MKPSRFFLCLAISLLAINAYSQDKNWTHFRGTAMNSVSTTTGIPLKWEGSAIKWKTEIHGKGHSSPVVFGNQIWITTGTPDGKELYAVCTDFQSGKILYDIKVFTPESLEGKHSINTFASPTPCIEKGFVYVHFGSYGTACIKTSDGTVVWKRTDYKCKHVQGPASSPVIYKNLLILHFEGTDVRYIVALDKATGQEVWRTNRPEEPFKSLTQIGRKAYVTPLIINVKGRDLMISNSSAGCFAYEPLTGKEVWRVIRGAESTVPMPVYENGVIYYYTGYMVDEEAPNFSELLAVNPDGKGDITTTNILWKKRDNQNTNQILTPVIKDGLIYTVNTKNTMMCIDATSGKELWTERQMANYNASPVYADGKVWFFSVKGDVVVLTAGRNQALASRFTMDSGIWATPAFLRNSVILRTEKYLCRIGK
jgi:outer membrane protein assembly factor BamB